MTHAPPSPFDWHSVARRPAMREYLPSTRNGAGAGQSWDAGEPGPSVMEETILVIEDDLGMREIAMSILDYLGYRTCGAADGRAGLEAIERCSDITLLVCDVVLPGGMSGPELVREALARRPGLKVLFMSGYPDVYGSQAEQLDQGAKLIRKPFRRSELGDMVRDLLDE